MLLMKIMRQMVGRPVSNEEIAKHRPELITIPRRP